MAGPLSDMGGGGRRPLFLAIYATVVTGIVFSALFVLSSLSATTQVRTVASSFLSSPSSLPPLPAHPSTAHVVTKEPAHQSDNHSPWSREIWDAPPSGTKMPQLESFRLTKEMAKHRAQDNVLVVTFGNHAFMDFILTWVRHLTDLNVTNILVGAMDDKLLANLYWKGIPVFDMGSKMNTIDVGWGTAAFHKMGREKVFLINALLPYGHEVLMCDTDMVWLKNPLPYLARFPDADLLTSSDLLFPTVTDDSLEVWTEAHSSFNIGIFHWRPTKSSLKLAKEWRDLLVSDEKIWDQTGFNDLVRKKFGPSVGDDGLVYAFDGTLKLGILPTSIFCGGHTYFVQGMPQQLKLAPYAVHATFQYAGTDGKRHRMREALAFYDPPEYYDDPAGFMSFGLYIPKHMLLDGEHNIENHFFLVNHQIKQIRTALAVASLLNRTLVMPPLWCRLDRFWFGHPGITPGTLTRQPFICPMDHVFEVNNMMAVFPEAEFGSRINFREYSFLENPRLPQHVKDSRLEVKISKEQSVDHEVNKNGLLRIPRNCSDETLLQTLSSYKDVKIIHFSSMEGVFQGFTDQRREEKFRKRVKRYTGIWCCMENREIGHIYYDIYWDEKPSWKPQPPATRADDHPPL